MASVFHSTPISPDFSLVLRYLQSASEILKTGQVAEHTNERKEALKIAKGLVIALEQPEEVVMRWGFEVTIASVAICLVSAYLHHIQLGSQQACLRLGIDLKLFHTLAEMNGIPISASELARRSNAEGLLVSTYREWVLVSNLC